MKVEFILGTGFENAVHKEIVDLPENSSGGDIENVYQEWINSLLNKGWFVLGENDECNN